MILSDVGDGVGHLEGEDNSTAGIDGGSGRLDIGNHRLGGIDRDVAHNLRGLAERIGGDDRDRVTTISGESDRLAERPIGTESDGFSSTAVDLDNDPGDGDASDRCSSSACNGNGLGVGKQIVRRRGDVKGRSRGRNIDEHPSYACGNIWQLSATMRSPSFVSRQIQEMSPVFIVRTSCC